MRALVDSARSTAADDGSYRFVFGVDPDDSASAATARELEADASVGPGHCGVHWHRMSLALDSASESDLVMLCADDIRFESSGWDHKMLERREHGVLYFGEDGIQHAALATHPWMTVRTVRALGGLTTGEWAIYNDTWLWCLFGLFDPPAREYRPEIVTRHHWAGENPRNLTRHDDARARFAAVGSDLATRAFVGLRALREGTVREHSGLHGLGMSLVDGRVEVTFA